MNVHASVKSLLRTSSVAGWQTSLSAIGNSISTTLAALSALSLTTAIIASAVDACAQVALIEGFARFPVHQDRAAYFSFALPP